MMNVRRGRGFLLCLLASFLSLSVKAAYYDDAYGNNNGYDDAYAAADDQYGGDDDGGAAKYQNYGNDITYWTDYAVLPKRCIVYNNVDMIVFSVFENGYKQCSDKPMGTYVAPVPYFIDAYLDELETKAEETGDDWVKPDEYEYAICTEIEIQNTIYYTQIGCSDTSTQELAVNIYTDNTCETRSSLNGYDDANIDVSSIAIPFKQCQACVSWGDTNQNDVDDQFYQNKATNAPLCSQIWQTKSTCDKRCQKIGAESPSAWNSSDKMLFTILCLFGTGMLITIFLKRRSMTNKELLLEQAAMSAAGVQPSHVIGVFVLVVLIIAVFALLGLKTITWFLLLLINICLFAYLMKLTVESSVAGGTTQVGSDGKIIPDTGSDESSQHSENPNAGTYSLPNLA